MNPIQTIKSFILKGFSPQRIVEQFAGNNPMFTNLIKMANNGDINGVENFARNVFKEKGRDFDKEFSEFNSKFK